MIEHALLLMTAQGLMGAFDTIYHHELTERLTWRCSAAPELRIHAIRSLIYAFLFAGLGLFEFHGLWAWGVALAFIGEIGLTLQDFVTEDRTRDLPASERVTHTLLAINGGAFLALLLPGLVAWAAQPTSIKTAHHGVLGWILALFGLGLVVWAWRDASRSRALMRTPVTATQTFPRLAAHSSVLVTGGTGFIGSRLCAVLAEAGHDVTVLTRTLRRARGLHPRVRVVDDFEDIESDRYFDAIVNLAGAPIATRPWTAARKRLLIQSRVGMTEKLAVLIARLDRRPRVLINGSAVGYYGIDEGRTFVEGDEGTDCFSRELCLAWEHAAVEIEKLGVRVCRLRIGLVLAASGGVLGQLLLPFEFGLGGPIGNGRHWTSWIHRDDVVGLILHGIAHEETAGAMNATAPQPVTNRAFTSALGLALHRPTWFPLPAPILRLALGEMAKELLLSGQRVLPLRAEQTGYRFLYPDLTAALREIIVS